MARNILRPIQNSTQAAAYVDNMMRRSDGLDQTAIEASPINVEPITPEQSVPNFSSLHYCTVTPLTPLTSEDDVVFSREPPQINEAQYDEAIDRLLHYRNGPGYASIWNNILGDLDPNLPEEVRNEAIMLRIWQLRHDSRFSVENADRIKDDFWLYWNGRLPYSFDEEMRLHREEEARSEQSLREWQQRYPFTPPEPTENVLGTVGRTAWSALRTAAGGMVVAALIARTQRRD